VGKITFPCVLDFTNRVGVAGCSKSKHVQHIVRLGFPLKSVPRFRSSRDFAEGSFNTCEATYLPIGIQRMFLTAVELDSSGYRAASYRLPSKSVEMIRGHSITLHRRPHAWSVRTLEPVIPSSLLSLAVEVLE